MDRRPVSRSPAPMLDGFALEVGEVGLDARMAQPRAVSATSPAARPASSAAPRSNPSAIRRRTMSASVVAHSCSVAWATSARMAAKAPRRRGRGFHHGSLLADRVGVGTSGSRRAGRGARPGRPTQATLRHVGTPRWRAGGSGSPVSETSSRAVRSRAPVAESTASAAIERHAVSLPPATVVSPPRPVGGRGPRAGAYGSRHLAEPLRAASATGRPPQPTCRPRAGGLREAGSGRPRRHGGPPRRSSRALLRSVGVRIGGADHRAALPRDRSTAAESAGCSERHGAAGRIKGKCRWTPCVRRRIRLRSTPGRRGPPSTTGRPR